MELCNTDVHLDSKERDHIVETLIDLSTLGEIKDPQLGDKDD